MLKIRQLDEEIENAEKEYRIEKRFCDFWFNLARFFMGKITEANGACYAFINYANEYFPDKELSRVYASLQEDPSFLGDELKFRYVYFYWDGIEIFQSPNHRRAQVVLPFKKIKIIEIFRGTTILK